jgi:glycosyltransferase
MKVSIITATYNSAATIADTVRSLENQTHNDIEYIIIDGASKDGTLDIIREHCTRVAMLVSEPDKGIYDALNKGIILSTGDIIGFLHSDDMLAYPDAIKDLVATISKDNADCVYADLNYVDKTDTKRIVRHWHSGTFNAGKLRKGWMPPHPTFYMKKSLYEKLGGFDLNYKICSDYDSVIRYLKEDGIKVTYLPSVVMKMRVGGASNNSFINMLRKLKEEISILRKNCIFWPTALLLKRTSKISQFFLSGR